MWLASECSSHDNERQFRAGRDAERDQRLLAGATARPAVRGVATMWIVAWVEVPRTTSRSERSI